MQVYKINGMIELEKMRTLIARNLYNFGAHKIIKILLVLHNAHIVPKNQLFHVNCYIDWNQFNQLYDPNQIEKNIKNVDRILCKLRLALRKAINHKLEVSRKKKQKKEEIIAMRKTKAMAATCQRAKGRISGNYQSDIGDKTDLR